MAFISEIDFRGGGGAGNGESIEIILGPGDDPADFVVSAYRNNGALHTSAGIPGGEVTLSSLTGTPDPDNPGFTVYVIPLGLRNGPSNANEASGVALTDTSSGNVISFFSSDRQGTITATEGAANGVASDPFLDHRALSAGESYQWDIFGNQTIGPATPGDAVLCLTAGSAVRTSNGHVCPTQLAAGDLVWTLDHGYQPLRWVGLRRVTAQELSNQPMQRPILLGQGALSEGVPRTDLHLSPQHRVLIRSAVAQRMFGSEEVLAAAKKLDAFDGITAAKCPDGVIYVHLLFDRHEIIDVNGALVESLLIADQSTAGLLDGSLLSQAGNLPPVSMAATPCRQIAQGRRLRHLLERMQKNGKDLQPAAISYPSPQRVGRGNSGL